MPKDITDKQRQVLDLLRQDKKPAEIARKLKMSPQAVYQHITRLREGGHLPATGKAKATPRKGSGAKARIARRSQARAVTPEPAAPEPSANGNGAVHRAEFSIEEHINVDLKSVQDRLDAIDAEQGALLSEQETLAARREQLAAAQAAFAPAPA